DLGPDRLGDVPEVLDLVAGRPVGAARVDVDHHAALVGDAARLGAVLLGRVRDRRALVAVGQRSGDRAGDDDGIVEAQSVSLRGKWEVLLPTLPQARTLVQRAPGGLKLPHSVLWQGCLCRSFGTSASLPPRMVHAESPSRCGRAR